MPFVLEGCIQEIFARRVWVILRSASGNALLLCLLSELRFTAL